LANTMHAWHLKNFTEYVSLSPWKPVIWISPGFTSTKTYTAINQDSCNKDSSFVCQFTHVIALSKYWDDNFTRFRGGPSLFVRMKLGFFSFIVGEVTWFSLSLSLSLSLYIYIYIYIYIFYDYFD
jgi:hypothetical protein